MSSHVFGVEIPLADGYSWFELVRCDTPERTAEVVRVLLSSGAAGPVSIKVVVHPAVPPADVVSGQ